MSGGWGYGPSADCSFTNIEKPPNSGICGVGGAHNIGVSSKSENNAVIAFGRILVNSKGNKYRGIKVNKTFTISSYQ